MEKTVTYHRRAEEGTLTLCGVVDIFEAGALREAALRALADTKAVTLRLDLSHAERLDMSALQILCALRRDVDAHGRVFDPISVPPALETLLAQIGHAL